MTYVLQAVIAGEDLLRSAAQKAPGAHVASLGQGLSLLPMTSEVLDAVPDADAARSLGFRRLPTGFELKLAEWSAVGPVAYVEAEYFGGAGEQRAVVWADGALAWGPSDQRALGISPISQALRRLGATSGPDQDEFTAVGLDRHRHNDGWISATP
ncbi:hypothetical protein JHN63_03630 [Streptomyces sp. MBT65]|uniref:hypothetical protein n=1 Tax=Streptomyces sp. MBT65 TaxID=1488395 RepID=UPI00190DD3DD|nr:hypothetical protein [Streptomyces sp. MBT65]MBK3572930.1 hypothetical protein [Streptomyces sp. MBT65]